MKRGSALLMSLWIILVLGVIAISFAFEAKLQGGINVYVQGKNRVKRLIESGKTIGEVVMLGYEEAKDPEMDGDKPDWTELLEDDRWCREKYDLKNSSMCTIGPILLDEVDPETGKRRTEADVGTVTVEITMSHAEQGGGININRLYSADANYITRWQMILDLCGVPREDNFKTEDGKSINLQYHVIGCWNDYRDDDDTRTAIDGQEVGAEKKDYEEYYDDKEDRVAEEDRFEPANGEIADLKELSRVLCFQEYPALLTGGVVNPWEDKKSQLTVGGLLHMGLFSVTGTEKVNVNDCTVNQLLTVPGIFVEDEVDSDDKSESREIAEAIVKCRTIKPEDDDERVMCNGIYPYKDWDDLTKRVSDETDADIGQEANKYFEYKPEKETLFKMIITASLMDMSYKAECECYVKDKKIRYVSWKE